MKDHRATIHFYRGLGYHKFRHYLYKGEINITKMNGEKQERIYIKMDSPFKEIF
jgi:hypothetical protein